MPREWEEFDGWRDCKELQPGDTVGIAGVHDEIVTVIKVSPSGQVTTTSAQTKWDWRTSRYESSERRYFTARGYEKGHADSHYNAPRLTGTKEVRQLMRAHHYAKAVGELATFVEKIDKARGSNSYGSYRQKGEPITMDEYREIARLAKLCLDDGQGEKRPTVYCLECWAVQDKPGRPHVNSCSHYVAPPGPEPEAPPCPDGVCPGCGRAGKTPCPADCPVLSHPPAPPEGFDPYLEGILGHPPRSEGGA
jgi:hypothetical protein